MASGPVGSDVRSVGVPRVLWALGAFAVALGCVAWGLWVLVPLLLGGSLLALHEYGRLLAAHDLPIRGRTLGLAAVVTLPAAIPVELGWIPWVPDAVGPREVVVGLVALVLIALELGTPNERSIQVVAFSLFAYLYIPFAVSHAITLRFTPGADGGAWLLLVAVLGITGSDVGGFVVGRAIGRRPLAPRVSPRKTVEGALGGIALGVAATGAALTVGPTLLGAAAPDVPFGLGAGLALAAIAAVAAQVGDLFESLLKRWSGVKDAGRLMPGHGGALDRMDSWLVALPVTYYVAVLFVV